MKTKEEEINAIRALVAMDGYFADTFGKDLEQIEQNIQDDFSLLFDTSINREVERLKQKIDELKQEMAEDKDKLHYLCRHLLNVAAGIEVDSLDEVVVSAIGALETIKLKLDEGLPVTGKDARFLVDLVEEKSRLNTAAS